LSIINDEGFAEWEADLDEDGDPTDFEAHQYRTAVPTWHGLSKGGDVTGELVYANYGNQEVCTFGPERILLMFSEGLCRARRCRDEFHGENSYYSLWRHLPWFEGM
jgi:hypothetical protein